MPKKWIFIQPQDVWMFRDGKPFTAGQSFVARSSFPPNPQTMQGAIRTQAIEESGIDWSAFGNRRNESLIEKIGAPSVRQGDKATLGNFEIRGPLVARRTGKDPVELLIPTPLDVMKSKGQESNQQPLALLSPDLTEPDFLTNEPFEGWRPLTTPEGDYEFAGGWLDEENLGFYLAGETPKYIIETKHIFESDPRVGLAIDYGRRASHEHHVYHAEFVRPHDDIGLLVEVDSDLLSDHGYISLGGESRMGYYETVDFPFPQSNISGNLKIALLTPAYFEGGWHPQNMDWSPWVGNEARLVSMAIGKPTLISGWDTVRKQPKTLHHYVSTGSVFYFENAEIPQQPFTESIQDEDFVDGFMPIGQLGFGTFIAATW